MNRQIVDGDPNLENLMKLLPQELQAQERSMSGEFPPVKTREKTGKSPNTAAALLTGGSETIPTCYYCRQAHLSYACRNVTSIDERKCLLQEASRCFVCLRRGHIMHQCTSKSQCPHCRGQHHGSICTGQESSPVARRVPERVLEGAHQQLQLWPQE